VESCKGLRYFNSFESFDHTTFAGAGARQRRSDGGSGRDGLHFVGAGRAGSEVSDTGRHDSRSRDAAAAAVFAIFCVRRGLVTRPAGQTLTRGGGARERAAAGDRGDSPAGEACTGTAGVKHRKTYGARVYENCDDYGQGSAGIDVFCVRVKPVPEISADASAVRSVGTISGSAVCFALRLAGGSGAGAQWGTVFDWQVRTAGDCVERAGLAQHYCIPRDHAAERGTACGAGCDLLGYPVLAVSRVVCTALGGEGGAEVSAQKKKQIPRCARNDRFILLLGLRNSAEAEVFDFQVFVHAVLGAFAAQAGFFYPAERRDFGGDEASVDADDAVFEGFGDAPDARQILPIKIGGETEFGGVGERDGFGFGCEAEQRGDLAEGFFARDGRLICTFLH
jgi:hypothetical protein